MLALHFILYFSGHSLTKFYHPWWNTKNKIHDVALEGHMYMYIFYFLTVEYKTTEIYSVK